jgi:hypothetical protein
MAVFVLDRRKKPLMPCAEKRARLLLERGRAVVHRRYPFTIRLKDRVGGDVQPTRPTAVVQGISWRDCRMLSRGDGYTYHTRALLVAARSIPPTANAGGSLEVFR